MKAKGEPVIGFGAGEPDFPTPEHIVQAAAHAVAQVPNHRYSPTPGLPELREAIVDSMRRETGFEVQASQVVVTNGGKQAVFQACAAVINEGDDVLLPAPYWTTYPEVIKLAGGHPIDVFAGADQDYKVTVEQLEKALTPRTTTVILCSPSNPTGSVYTAEELKAIGQWALERQLWVLTDEIYQQLTYGGVEAASLPVVVPDIAENCIVMSGVAKTYAMTGWRVGWMVGPADAISAASTFQSHTTSNVNNVAQRAAIAALTGPRDAVESMRGAFDRRRKNMVSLLNEIDGFTCPTPHGAFYVYPDVRAWIGRPLGGTTVESSAHLAEIILEKAKVAVVPGEAFGPTGYLRLSYALGDDDLREGVERIRDLLSQG
ncbi:CoA-disulfide reductase [Platysternon megacephalum]|uniref:CoA-disulfide reductase n=1 Tax=Platysternon megacephalum TaxID=55544 RepID=A0A4D9DKN3_9SAUR|nr:CoA-disulfide reductase [Platysternon megacephalum]